MRLKRRLISGFLVSTIFFIFFTLFFNEFLVYYVTTFMCVWPALIDEITFHPLHAMILADTHLLGFRNGHWWDKLRREWQMHRAFQAAVTIHRPDIIFILGDIFDEGLWASDQEFDYYVKRFNSLFAVDKTPLIVIAGNHDVGFHYGMSKHLEQRFSSNMNSSMVKLITVKNIHFVLVNSMAMEGDGCFLCKKAEEQVRNISKILNCNKEGKCKQEPKLFYSQPILLQHFPLYRESDEVCEKSIVAPQPKVIEKFRQKRECLSKKSTFFLIDNLYPRMAIGGHTHHSCMVLHREQNSRADSTGAPMFEEYSTPSFSWRNRNDPSFYMTSFTPDEKGINRCELPKETTVIHNYIMFSIFFFTWMVYKCFSSKIQSILNRKNTNRSF